MWPRVTTKCKDTWSYGDCKNHWKYILHRTQVHYFCSGNSNQDLYVLISAPEPPSTLSSSSCLTTHGSRMERRSPSDTRYDHCLIPPDRGVVQTADGDQQLDHVLFIHWYSVAGSHEQPTSRISLLDWAKAALIHVREHQQHVLL